MKIIRKRIESGFKKAGGSKFKFYTQTGFAQQTVHKWQKGVVSPRMEDIERLADYLGLSLSDFFSGTEPPPPPKITPEMALEEITKCFKKHKDVLKDC